MTRINNVTMVNKLVDEIESYNLALLIYFKFNDIFENSELSSI